MEEVSRLLVDRAGEPTESLLPHLYVHYDDGAVSHLFHVAAGLDSMAVGEGQILGQARDALRVGQETGSVGPALNSLFQQALRVGKRAHAETDIDRAAPSLVTAALDLAGGPGAVSDRRVLVIGAGSMAALATATVTRLGAADVVVVNRTEPHAMRLAAEYAARSAPLDRLAKELGRADVVIACTGAVGHHVTVDLLPERPLVVIDLALPHDVDPAVGERPEVTLVNLGSLGSGGHEVDAVRDIVTAEVSAFASPPAAPGQRDPDARGAAVDGHRGGRRRAGAPRGAAARPRPRRARRAARATATGGRESCCTSPRCRLRLAHESGAVSYAAALAELFALDPEAVEAVTGPWCPSPRQAGRGVPA
ncbi:MAG: glutamyl-tRNA reductase [Nocardioides sp.]